MIFSEAPNLLISQRRKQSLLRAMRYGGQVVSSAAAHPPRPVGPDMPAGHERRLRGARTLTNQFPLPPVECMSGTDRDGIV